MTTELSTRREPNRWFSPLTWPGLLLRVCAALAFLPSGLVLFAVFIFCTGFTDGDGKDYLYMVGLEQCRYSASDSGPTPLGPMDYISTLDIAEDFAVTARCAAEADTLAKVRFTAEMEKIDTERLGVYRNFYMRYTLVSLEDERTVSCREFRSREDTAQVTNME